MSRLAACPLRGIAIDPLLVRLRAVARTRLLPIADAGDVRGDLDARRQTDASDLAERGVRLLGRRRVDARADAAALRRTAKSGALRLRPRALAPDLDQLLYRRHDALVCT